MNRTGLFIALTIAVVAGLVFGLSPDLDIRISGMFYDATIRAFPLARYAGAEFARRAAMWVTWLLVLPAMVAFVVKMIWPVKPLMMSGRAMTFLLVTMLLSAIVLSNVVFKGFWGRPRPVAVSQFNGKLDFVPWWDPRGKCPKNCSFFSGEGATAFWTYAPAALAPPAWRPVTYAAATAFGVATGGWRIAFGGHFFTDVLFSAVASFLVAWLCYAFIYRWPRTRMTDAGIDAGLTRFAWPGYRWRQKLLGRDVGDSPRIRPGTGSTTDVVPARAGTHNP
jgi:membrane-associated phospholipid phosphatase